MKGKDAEELTEISAWYLWNNRDHLIRKDRPRDWTLFIEQLSKVWDEQSDRFAKDYCEVMEDESDAVRVF